MELSTLVPLKKFLYASSSSVYGNIASLPATESHLPQPISPYGVSKLAGEQLCNLYYFNYAVPVVSLRYFTVYGPGQRPDMAFHQFIRSILKDEVILIYGDGSQTRDFTYIDDLVDANMSAINTPAIEGKVFNVGGGHRRRLEEVIEIIEDLIGRKARLNYQDRQKGDPRDTWADISQAEKYLSYRPRSSMREGLAKQVEYVNYLLRNKM